MEEKLFEEDKLLKFHDKLKDFIQKHLNLLLNVVLIFVIIIVLSFGWGYYQKYKEKKAYQELIALIHQRNDIKSLMEFTKKYSSTQAGLQASLILWEMVKDTGDLKTKEETLKLLQKVFPKGLKEALSYASAKLKEDKGALKEAVSDYERIKLEPYKNLSQIDLIRLNAQKNLDKKELEELLKKFKDTPFYGYLEYKLEASTKKK